MVGKKPLLVSAVRADAIASRANGRIGRIFTSGRDFLDFERNDCCACLILDLRMSGAEWARCTKVDLCRDNYSCNLHHWARRHPIDGQSDERGAIDFLTKPIDEVALLTRIERCSWSDQVVLSRCSFG